MYDFLLKFVIIGDHNTGKTSLLKNYIQNVIPTIGVDFITTDIILNQKTFRLHIWDTSGNNSFLNIIKVYLKNSIGSIIVFNLNDINSFNNIDNWITHIASSSSSYHKNILIGTHSDKPRKISNEMIKIKCETYNLEYFETSPDFHIEYCFIKIINSIMKEFKKNPQIFSNLEGFHNQMTPISTSDYINFDNQQDFHINKNYCCTNNCSIL